MLEFIKAKFIKKRKNTNLALSRSIFLTHSSSIIFKQRLPDIIKFEPFNIKEWFVSNECEKFFENI